MKRTCLEEDDCPVARALDAIGDWWSLLIIRDAFQGVKRFGEFERGLGVAKNILTARLRKLVAVGILEVVPASDGSKYQEYVLTKKARGLYLVIIALKQWEESCFPGRKQDHVLIDRKKGQPVRSLELRAKDGRLLEPEDVQILATTKASAAKMRSP